MNATKTIMRTRWYLGALLLAAALSSMAAKAGAADKTGWSTDVAHTAISFSVKHFFTPVSGTFQDFEIVLDYNDAEPQKSTVEAKIKVASLDTGNSMRDDHLRTADWFEADKYPYITFRSNSVRRVGKDKLVASGPLTIKGETRQVQLPITLLGTQMIPENMRPMLGGAKEVKSFRASTSIDRGDFGVGTGSWAATMVVGGEVDIEILLEAHNV